MLAGKPGQFWSSTAGSGGWGLGACKGVGVPLGWQHPDCIRVAAGVCSVSGTSPWVSPPLQLTVQHHVFPVNLCLVILIKQVTLQLS